LNKLIKAQISKINFSLGENPIIEKRKEWREYIPESYKAVVVISADFEFAWAWQYAKAFDNPVEEAKKMAFRERANIPGILELCDAYKIPITWATVGHLFLESCNRINGLAHPEISRLPHFENDFCRFDRGDWFQHDPCSNYHDAPEWYCPDLIKMILNAKVKHEIGCHTFSHIDCRDGLCPTDLIRAELKECKKLAKEWGITLKSFVHPGYTIGNLGVLSEEGFTNFRTNDRNVLGYPQKHENGLWEFEQTTEFVYSKDWSVDYYIYRYITIIKRAIKSNTVCVFWFHPSFDPIIVEKILPEVFRFINEERKKIWVTTITEYVDWLENRLKQ
jgi:peptidoglycan/xylan/chitin deacetylase (PgdA/CDA1 family)